MAMVAGLRRELFHALKVTGKVLQVFVKSLNMLQDVVLNNLPFIACRVKIGSDPKPNSIS
jgi:hypothetical protein